jgi:hypothetical protein
MVCCEVKRRENKKKANEPRRNKEERKEKIDKTAEHNFGQVRALQ